MGKRNIQYWTKQYEVFKSEGKHEEALSVLDQAIAIEPKPTFLRAKTGTLFALGRHAEAISTAKDVISIEPTIDDFQILFVMLFFAWTTKHNERDNGLQNIETSSNLYPIKDYPEDAKDELSIAMDALEVIRTAVNFDPSFASGFYGLYALLNTMGKTEEALEYLELGIRSDPTNADIYAEKYSILCDIGRAQEALELNISATKILNKEAILNALDNKHFEHIEYDCISSIITRLVACINDIKKSDNFEEPGDDDDYVFYDKHSSITSFYHLLIGDTSRMQLNNFINDWSTHTTTEISNTNTFIDLWRRINFEFALRSIWWGIWTSNDVPAKIVEISDKSCTQVKSNVGVYDLELAKHENNRKRLQYVYSLLENHPDLRKPELLLRMSVIDDILIYLINKITEEKVIVEEQIKVAERNRILSNLSHSIKNMLRSVIDPLINLREELPDKANVIDNALKGANLIREIVNSINLSFKTSLDDLLWDIKHPGTESVALHDMIISSLQYSIGNMFDFRYFPAFAENYYPRSMKKKEFEAINEEWKPVSTTSSLSALQDFARKYLFNLSVELSCSAQYHIGNEKSSAIKLMILFQEIIFNAVKYASYVPLDSRFIDINLSEHEDKLKLEIRNSYRPEVQARTTGVGNLVIENFAKVLDCTPVITTEDNVYSIIMEFNNIWRNNA